MADVARGLGILARKRGRTGLDAWRLFIVVWRPPQVVYKTTLQMRNYWNKGRIFLLLVGMSTEKGGQQHLIKLVNKL